MNFIQEWQVLGIPLTVIIISQFIKVVLESGKHGFTWSHLNSYGGMPSSHTAGFVSLPMMIGLVEGFHSSLFAAAALFSLVIIRDAVGIRWSLGFHGKVLNHLLKTLPSKERALFPKKLQDRFGHTYGEVLAGTICGIILTAILYTVVNAS